MPFGVAGQRPSGPRPYLPVPIVLGKSKLVCPSNLAYRDKGLPPLIKPGATLVFEVELLEIVAK